MDPTSLLELSKPARILRQCKHGTASEPCFLQSTSGKAKTVDLNPASTAFRRRLVSDTVFLSYRPDCWTFNLRLEERVDKTTTSGGQETEYVDRTIFASVILGGVLLPEQTLPRAF